VNTRAQSTRQNPAQNSAQRTAQVTAVTSAQNAVRITVNGRAESCLGPATVGMLVAHLCPSPQGIAVAVGDAVVPRAEWDVWVLRDGDEVEILTAVQGG
jgi:sulfur carrier protein